MPNRISRYGGQPATYTLATSSGAVTSRIPYSANAGGMIYVTAGSNVTLTWYTSHSASGTLFQLYSSDGSTAVSQAVTSGRAYPIPDEAFGAAFIVPVSSAASTTIVVTPKG